MKGYRSYTAKKHKMPRRIIFFCVVALLIVVLTVIVGNVLKNKLETTPRDTSDILTTTSPEENKPQGEQTEGEKVNHDEAFKGVSAGYLDLSAVEGADKARDAVSLLKSQGYNAVSFVVTDESGRVTYASPAVEEFSRLTASASLVSFEELKAAAACAEDMGMRLCAVMTASDSMADELIAAELYSMGFDELIIRGFEEHVQFDNELVAKVNGYVNKLRNAADGMVFSLSFGSEFYKAPSNAPYIEKIYANTEFLSIDMTGCNAEAAAALCESIGGSFSAYLLRPLLSGADKEMAASVSDALSSSAISARQYISAPAAPADTEATDK